MRLLLWHKQTMFSNYFITITPNPSTTLSSQTCIQSFIFFLSAKPCKIIVTTVRNQFLFKIKKVYNDSLVLNLSKLIFAFLKVFCICHKLSVAKLRQRYHSLNYQKFHTNTPQMTHLYNSPFTIHTQYLSKGIQVFTEVFKHALIHLSCLQPNQISFCPAML